MTEDQIEEIGLKIASEGFDYYFTDYGADDALLREAAFEIGYYREARSVLMSRLRSLGIEVE